MKLENEVIENEKLVDIDAEIDKLVNKTFRKISLFSDKYGYEERFLYVTFMEKMKEIGFWTM